MVQLTHTCLCIAIQIVCAVLQSFCIADALLNLRFQVWSHAL